MMKKLIAALLTALLALSAVSGLAATYADSDKDISFEYDDSLFTIEMDDKTDDELLVILGFKDESWGDGYVRIHLRDLEDGETFPTKADFAEVEEALDTTVEQGEWNGFADVFSYTVYDADNTEAVFIVPVYDDDGKEIDDILTINISAAAIEDEETAMTRDDYISAIVDSLKLTDD